jgi:hypothetical protein
MGSTCDKALRDSALKYDKQKFTLVFKTPMKELWLRFLSFLGMAHWVEITTSSPRCTYYFGPFASQAGAEDAHFGYLEDLKEEGAQGIKVVIKACKPTTLTIFDEGEDFPRPFRPMMSISN